ncbi:MAG TPA: adenylate/guanylate cyclase domain-containing protein, partial [Anaerolineales bacterium]|nr:adenylate/guanylate cyclase domain-containing protein [Anaerolineales bacterium]
MTDISIRPIGESGHSHPSGTVTFLFTDIESSTHMWEQHPDEMKTAYARHESILRQAVASHNGYAYKMIGDAFQVAFETAPQALAAALEAQRALHAEPWPETCQMRVRMALHTGVTEERGDDYVGPALNRVARLLSAAYGGQVLLTQPVYDLVRDDLPFDI